MNDPVARRTAPDQNDSWASTRAMTATPTLLMGDEETYLATTSKAIGRRIDDEQHELFVVCDPGEALMQQFEHHLPEVITLHDLGLDSSSRLLRAVARATRRKVQKLIVRRQGFGVPLATLQFVELPGPEAVPPVRIYSTQVEVSDESQRVELAKVLLGHSRLGVILVGPGAASQNGARLQPLSDAMYEANWRNRQLLWLPIGPEAAPTPPSSLSSRRSLVQVHCVPPSADLAHAWPLISSLWDQLRSGGPVDASVISPAVPHSPPAGGAAHAAAHGHADTADAPHRHAGQAQPPAAHASSNETAHAPAPAHVSRPYTPTPLPPAPPPLRPAHEPLPLRPMPATMPAQLSEETTDTGIWRDYIRECAVIPGMVSCCVFELASQRPLAHAGTRPGAAALAARGATLYENLCATGRALGLKPGEPDLALTLAEHHLLLHPLEHHPGLLLHAVLDAHVANLTLVRMKLHRLDPGANGLPQG